MTVKNIQPTGIKNPVLLVTHEAVNSLSPMDRAAAEVLLKMGRWQYSDEKKAGAKA